MRNTDKFCSYHKINETEQIEVRNDSKCTNGKCNNQQQVVQMYPTDVLNKVTIEVHTQKKIKKKKRIKRKSSTEFCAHLGV